MMSKRDLQQRIDSLTNAVDRRDRTIDQYRTEIDRLKAEVVRLRDTNAMNQKWYERDRLAEQQRREFAAQQQANGLLDWPAHVHFNKDPKDWKDPKDPSGGRIVPPAWLPRRDLERQLQEAKTEIVGLKAKADSFEKAWLDVREDRDSEARRFANAEKMWNREAQRANDAEARADEFKMSWEKERAYRLSGGDTHNSSHQIADLKKRLGIANQSREDWKKKAEESWDREEQGARGLGRVRRELEQRNEQVKSLQAENDLLIRRHSDRRDAWIIKSREKSDLILKQAREIERLHAKVARKQVALDRDKDRIRHLEEIIAKDVATGLFETSKSLSDAMQVTPGEHPSASTFRIMTLVNNLEKQIRYYKGELAGRDFAIEALNAELAKTVVIGPIVDSFSNFRPTHWIGPDGMSGTFDPRAPGAVYPTLPEDECVDVAEARRKDEETNGD